MTTAQSVTLVEASASTVESIRTWAFAALLAFMASLVAYAGFMTVGGIWFTISDALGLALAGSMIPVMIGFDTLLRPAVGTTSRTAKWIGVTGMVIAGVGSIILLTSEVSHEFVPAGGGLGMQFVGFGLEGVWLLMVGVMVSRTAIMSRRVVWTCYLAGIGFVVGVLGAPLGPDSALVMSGAILSFVSFVLWVPWVRSELASGS